jgi:hypothetical protein
MYKPSSVLLSDGSINLNRGLSVSFENNQPGALYRLIYYYSKLALHVSGDVFPHHQEHFIVSGTINPSCCRLVSHSGHQPAAAWVNTTRYCKYSQVLPMMGENIARNM